jgi:gas vesicle protein
MMSNHKKSCRSFTKGALLGGIVCWLIALMFVPKSGKKMRKELSKSYHRVSEEVRGLMESLSNSTMDLAEKAKAIAIDAKTAAKKCKKR